MACYKQYNKIVDLEVPTLDQDFYKLATRNMKLDEVKIKRKDFAKMEHRTRASVYMLNHLSWFQTTAYMQVAQTMDKMEEDQKEKVSPALSYIRSVDTAVQDLARVLIYNIVDMTLINRDNFFQFIFMPVKDRNELRKLPFTGDTLFDNDKILEVYSSLQGDNQFKVNSLLLKEQLDKAHKEKERKDKDSSSSQIKNQKDQKGNDNNKNKGNRFGGSSQGWKARNQNKEGYKDKNKNDQGNKNKSTDQ